MSTTAMIYLFVFTSVALVYGVRWYTYVTYGEDEEDW